MGDKLLIFLKLLRKANLPKANLLKYKNSQRLWDRGKIGIKLGTKRYISKVSNCSVEKDIHVNKPESVTFGM